MTKRELDSVMKTPSKCSSTSQGAASISPAMKTETFPAGAEVEVKISADGFYDSWYEAKVLSQRSSGPRGVKYKVQYLEFLRDDGSGEPLVEQVNAKDVRPRAPLRLSEAGSTGNEDEDPKFKMYDLVEAYHNDGWWHGVISGLRDPETDLYTVSFPNSREVFQFKPAEIRPKLTFVNGNWVSVLEEQTEGNFKEGDNVEVHQLRDDIQVYFPATVEKVIHNSYYLVKYESPCGRPNGGLTEILDPLYLRPAPDGIPETSCFKAGSHVEVFHKGSWSPGIVLSCPSDSDYEVTLESKCKPMTVNISNLRVRLDWDGQNWSKWSSPSKEKKRTSAHSSKSFTSDVTLAEKGEITPNSVVSTGKKLKKENSEKVQEFQNPLQHKVTPSMDLEYEDGIPITKLFRVRPKLSKSNRSSSPKIMCAVRKISHSRRLLTELKDCQSKIFKGKRSCICKANLNNCKIDKLQDDVNHNGWIALEKQNNVILSKESSSDVPQSNTKFLLPFKKASPIWKTLEAFNVFNHIPQMPHFRTLESKCKEEREGLAIGMMVTYANQAESIQSLSIDTEMTVFEEKIACLVSLEENGFIVDPIRSHLQDLLAIKTDDMKSALKQIELETALVKKEQENMSSLEAANGYEAELEDVRKKLEDFRKSVAELELKEKTIMKEKERVLSSTVEGEHIVSRLREEISSIKSSHALNLEKFERVRSRPSTKELFVGCI